jgi:hypothetical protein
MEIFDMSTQVQGVIVENNTEYQKLVLSYSNVQGGAVTVNLSTKADQPKAAYSTGPNFSTVGGLDITMTPGNVLPVTLFRVNQTTTIVQAQSSSSSGGSSGSASLSFNVTLYVAGQPGIQQFSLNLQPGMDGVMVSAALGDQLPQNLTAGRPVTIDWNPS